MTKYSNIPTYHKLGNKGTLTDETVSFDGQISLSEKIDGTNCRIILLPDGNFVLGSREELLFAKGDLIGNPALGIVDALGDLAKSLPCPSDKIAVLYLELYGGKITAASKQYTAQQKVGWRLFDIIVLPDYAERFEKPIEQLSAWRSCGGQRFLSEEELTDAARNYGLELVPSLGTVSTLPISIEDTHKFLNEVIPQTKAALDEGARKRPEGIVARTASRSAHPCKGYR